MHPLIYPLIPAFVIGILNWLYWKKQGFTSPVYLVLGIISFYVIFYKFITLFYGDH